MKDELAKFALERLRQHGFSGRGSTVRVVGPDLQWVAQVEKIGHVDQVNVELGVVFATAPPATRTQCRVLWSLATFVGVESDEVARVLVPATGYSLEEREQVLGEALDAAAGVVHAHPDLAGLRAAYREGKLHRAFLFKDARELLEAS